MRKKIPALAAAAAIIMHLTVACKSEPRPYLEAAERQSGQYRGERALQLVQRGLELAFEEERHALFCLEGELLRMLGESRKSIESYKKARDIATSDVERCQALLGMAEGFNIIETHEELFETLREAENLASANRLTYELACIYQIRSGVFFFKGEIESALKTMIKKDVVLTGSGRTDAGVHALGQVASFRCAVKLAPQAFQAGLNSLLDDDIVIQDCELVDEQFHARYDAKA